MITVQDIVKVLEDFAPRETQMSYDNAGLQVGLPDGELYSVLLTTDVTMEVLEEALTLGCRMIVAHHPLIFKGLKAITGTDAVQRMVAFAMKHDIAIYAGHTNVDVAFGGVSWHLGSKWGLQGMQPLEPSDEPLLKMVVFVPADYVEKVRTALFEAGCGEIGRYDQCSFQASGSGSFRAQERTQPFVGEVGEFHQEPEIRLETIVPAFLAGRAVAAIKRTHPYEEPAYDLYPLKNHHSLRGSGVVGTLPEPVDEHVFLQRIKDVCGTPVLRHTSLLGKPVHRVAVCGGSGSSLLSLAVRSGADVFISADFKYHDFAAVEHRLVVVDAGHFETEQFTKEIFYEVLTKKFPNFAFCFSQVNTNPINYC